MLVLSNISALLQRILHCVSNLIMVHYSHVTCSTRRQNSNNDMKQTPATGTIHLNSFPSD
jgi:hypothetical protein